MIRLMLLALGSLSLTEIADAKVLRSAGPGSSGGGGGVACIDDVLAPGTDYRDFFKPTYNPRGEPAHVWVLDYFQSKIPTVGGKVQPNLFDGAAAQMNEAEAFELLKSQFELVADADARFNTYDQSIGPIESWVDSPLQDSNDSGHMYRLPKGCRYVQLAYRQNEVVYGDSEWIRKLDGVQRAILRSHEIYFYAYLSSLPQSESRVNQTSVPVRDLMKKILLREAPDTIAYSQRIEYLALAFASTFKSLGYEGVYMADGQRRFPFHYLSMTIEHLVDPTARRGTPAELVQMGERVFYERPIFDAMVAAKWNHYILTSNWKLAFNIVMTCIHHNLAMIRSFASTTPQVKKEAQKYIEWLEVNREAILKLPNSDQVIFEGALNLAKATL